MRYIGLMVAIGVLLAAVPADARADDVPEKAEPQKITWAQIELKGAYPEGAQSPGLFGDLTESLADGLRRLERAADDKAISGVILKFNSPTLGRAKSNEFRTAIKGIRDSGKPVYAWFDDASTGDYVLATACDKIIMPESGTLMLLGLRAEVTFYKNLFEMLDIQADMLRVGEFKSGIEPYTRTEMSPEFRKEMEAILDDYYRQMTETISANRGMDAAAVDKAIDSGPHTAGAAKNLGLIDTIAYEDELQKLILGDKTDRKLEIARRYGKRKLDTDFSGFTGMMKLMNLLMGIEPSRRRSTAPQVAVIHATGMIMSGPSTSDLLGTTVVGSETMIKAIQKAGDDPEVKAIVLRVDSPGGSALASDLIWRALETVDKPIVASMGDVAASGGYYIAMGAERIFAEPGTLTGSIGVYGGKLALEGLLNKVGVTTSIVSRGQNTGTMSPLTAFSDSERRAMTKLLHEVYEQFTRKAALGRKMEHAQLEKLARGRIYTGEMALKVGLIDELGTLDNAIDHTKTLIGLHKTDDVELLILPRPVSPFEQLFGPIDGETRSTRSSALAIEQTLRALSPELAAAIRDISIVNILARESRLTLLPFRLSIR